MRIDLNGKLLKELATFLAQSSRIIYYKRVYIHNAI